jgi:hypothetical protein
VLQKEDVCQRVPRPYRGQEFPPGALPAMNHAMIEIVALGDRALFQLPVDLIGLGKRW